MGFIEKYKNLIILILLIFITINSCSNNSKINKIKKDIDTLKTKTISKDVLEKIIIKEGLKVEKRMIQSTNRKLLDLDRQKEIDIELKKIE